MNRKDYIRRRTMLNYLESARNKDINKLKTSVANTDAHELVKYLVYRRLLSEGNEVVTEAIFSNQRGRADIFDITDGIVYEIINTEKEASIIRKRKSYPVPVEVISVKGYLTNWIKNELRRLVNKSI